VKLEAENLSFSYGSREVLRGVSFTLEPATCLGLVGPNGCGKSTLIKCLNRILVPKGQVRLDGREMRSLGSVEIALCMSYVPQATTVGMAITVFDFLLMGRRPHVRWSVSDHDVEMVTKAIQLLGLQDLAFRKTTQISGGERQKVLIARALAQEPSILLLDEPTSSLDLRHQMEVMELVRTLARERGMGVFMALHDLNLAARYCDKIVMLKDGSIVGEGTPSELLVPSIIQSVYGIEVSIHQEGEVPYVLPLRPIKEEK
jgi:iron complex transport system ATP-binding protein